MHLFHEKIQNYLFIIILVEIWLVELNLKFVAFCHTQIGPFLSKMVKMMSFWLKMTQNERLSDFSPNYVVPFPNFVYNLICNTLEL